MWNPGPLKIKAGAENTRRAGPPHRSQRSTASPTGCTTSNSCLHLVHRYSYVGKQPHLTSVSLLTRLSHYLIVVSTPRACQVTRDAGHAPLNAGTKPLRSGRQLGE